MIRPIVFRLGWLATLCLGAGFAVAQEAEAIFLETATAYVTVQLDSVDTYVYEFTYKVYFKGDAVQARVRVGTTPEGRPRFQRKSVATVASVDAERLALVACVGDRCITVGPAHGVEVRVEPKDTHLQVQLGRPPARAGDLPRNIAAGKAEIFLAAGPGLARVVRAEGDEPTDSAPLDVVLPALGQADSEFLGATPTLRFRIAPVVQDQNAGDEDGAALAFEGGVYRYRRSYRFGAAYSGDISTRDELSFSQLTLDADYERNLSARGYLPLHVVLGAESDQQGEVINGLLGVRLQYLLPFNVNRSPPEAFIPNSGPLLELRAELARNISDDDAFAVPDEFERLGYSLRWMVPVARETVVRLHHAGAWVLVDEADGDDEFRRLWELTLETKIGNLTWFVGWQEGEAAPLYRPVETTRAGLVYRFD